MKKIVGIVTYAALTLAKRLLIPRDRANSEEMLATYSEAKPKKQTQVVLATSSTRQQRRKEAMAGRGRKRRQEKYHRQRRKRLSRIVSALILIFGVIGSGVSIYSFLTARVPVSPSSPLDPNNPLSTLFSISNDGSLSVYDVQATCRVNNISSGQNDMISNIGGNLGSADARELSPGDKITMDCFIRAISGSIPWTSGDLDIRISYRPSFYPWRQERKIKFRAERGANGLHWFQQSSNNSDK